MTHEQFKQARQALGLSQEAMGDVLGLTSRQIRRYEVGEYPVPKTVALVVQSMMENDT